MIKNFKADALDVRIFDSSVEAGKSAAELVASRLKTAISSRGKANLILATGASQFDFLESFKADKSVEWSKVTVFHLDEYKDMSDRHPASFRRYLRERILDDAFGKRGIGQVIGDEVQLRHAESQPTLAHVEFAVDRVVQAEHVAIGQLRLLFPALKKGRRGDPIAGRHPQRPP